MISENKIKKKILYLKLTAFHKRFQAKIKNYINQNNNWQLMKV